MSDNRLDALIAKVKSEAIDRAEKESQHIINEARKTAQQLIKKAEDEKKQILNVAKKEAEATLHKGKSALKQASRDVHISVKNDLLNLFKAVLEAEIGTAFTPELYKLVLAKVIDNIGQNVTIRLPDDLEDQLVDAIRHRVRESSNTVSILKDKALLAGLSVTKTDEGWNYQITADEFSDLLSRHLSQKWIKILNTH